MTRMSMWTVYDRPSDFPDSYVARQWIITAGRVEPSPNLMIAPDLEMLREVLLTQMHMHRLPRSPGDDPVIVETWM